MLTRGRGRLRSALQLDNIDEFVQHFLAALEDSRVVDSFRLIMQPSISESLDSVTGTLKAMVADLQQTVSALQSTIKKRDDEILTLRREVNDLRAHNDDLEQHSRRASVRVFGVPENTPGSTDDMLLDLCNKALKLRPPLALEEIEVSHRVGKVVEEMTQSEDGQTVVVAKPRPIIVKFVSRRTKARVMAARKNLKKMKSWAPQVYSAGVCIYMWMYVCVCMCVYIYIYSIYIQQLSQNIIWLAIFFGIAPLTLGQWYLYDCPRVSDADSGMWIIYLSSHCRTKRKWAMCAVLKKSMLNGRSL